MKLIIEIDTSNEAFDDAPGFEVARILRDLAGKLDTRSRQSLRDRAEDLSLRDSNGNTVGKVMVR